MVYQDDRFNLLYFMKFIFRTYIDFLFKIKIYVVDTTLLT